MMTKKGGVIAASLLMLGILIFGVSASLAQPEFGGFGVAAQFDGFGQVGRFKVVRADEKEIILLDTTSGKLYKATPEDYLPHSKLPKRPQFPGFPGGPGGPPGGFPGEFPGDVPGDPGDLKDAPAPRVDAPFPKDFREQYFPKPVGDFGKGDEKDRPRKGVDPVEKEEKKAPKDK